MHPKDKVVDKRKTDCVYQITCKTCNMCYLGATGRTFDSRLDDQKKEGETITTRRFTRQTRRCSTSIEHTSAIADPADRYRLGGSENGG